MATLDQLMQALDDMARDGDTKATSLRFPEPLYRAAACAVELGMDESMTAAISQALNERVRKFARQQALAEHFAKYPDDVPELVDIAKLRVSGTDHVAVERPDLVELAAAHVEREHPDWVIRGKVDIAVDTVLDMVEAMALVAPAKPRKNKKQQSRHGG